MTFECDKGYYTEDKVDVKCMENRKYTKVKAFCLPIDCGIPYKLLYGTTEYNESYYCMIFLLML